MKKIININLEECVKRKKNIILMQINKNKIYRYLKLSKKII